MVWKTDRSEKLNNNFNKCPTFFLTDIPFDSNHNKISKMYFHPKKSTGKNQNTHFVSLLIWFEAISRSFHVRYFYRPFFMIARFLLWLLLIFYSKKHQNYIFLRHSSTYEDPPNKNAPNFMWLLFCTHTLIHSYSQKLVQ